MPELTEKYLEYIEPSERQRGEELLASGGVRLLQGNADSVSGEWYEGEGGECTLQVSERRLVAKCDCGQVGQRLCRHLWGLLLAASRSGELSCALKRNVKFGAGGVKVGQRTEQETDEPHYEYLTKPRKKAVPEATAEPDHELRYEPLATGSRRRLGQSSPEKQWQKARHSQAAALKVSSYEEEGSLLFVWRLEAQPADANRLRCELWRSQIGSDGKRHCHPVKPEEISTVPSENDKILLALLLNFGQVYEGRGNGLEISLAQLKVAAQVLRNSDNLRVLAMVAGRPQLQRVKLEIEKLGRVKFACSQVQENGWLLEDNIQLADEYFEGGEIQEILDNGWVLAGECLFRLESPGMLSLLKEMRQGSRVMMSNRLSEFVNRLRLCGAEIEGELPSSAQDEIEEGTPRGVLHIEVAEFKEHGHEQLNVELTFDYGGTPGNCHFWDETPYAETKGGLVRRNHAAERQLVERLQELGFTRQPRHLGREWQLMPSLLDNAVRELVLDDWLVTAQGKRYVRPVTRQPQIRRRGSTDWFELEGSVEFEGREMSFPALLRACQGGAHTVRLDDGTEGILPLEWLEAYTALTEFGQVEGGKIIFRVQQALVIDALLKGRLEDLDGELTRTAESLRSFRTPAPLKAPAGFKAVLRPYQEEGLGWLVGMGRNGLGLCLADDMGLGKTVQVLALLRQRQLEGNRLPSLIVMPKSLLGNWQAEAARFAPTLRVDCYAGPGRTLRAVAEGELDILLTTYGTMRRDVSELAKIQFDYIILDESQAIKNVESSTARAARALRGEHRLAMTGTPIENSLGELFSQLEFLNPGLCGRESGVLRLADLSGKLSEERLARLRRNLKPFLLRRRKEEVVRDLPAKTEQVIFCEMDELQQHYYDELQDYYRQQFRKEAEEKGSKASSVEMLSALMRLRQAACHPRLVNPDLQVESAKVERLLANLEEIIGEGHRALVFSQFTSFLHIVETEISARGWQCCYLDGQTKNRTELVAEFQNNPEKKVFLISLKAGGVGLNLTAADYVFILDPWWNPAAEAQAVDRAYRIGQKRPVFAYRLITRGTVEEKVMKLQGEKRELAKAVLEGEHISGRQLSREDIEFLLAGG